MESLVKFWEWVAWAVQGILTAFAVVIWWNWRKLVSQVETDVALNKARHDETKREIHQLDLNQRDTVLAITNLKLYITENFSGKAETNASLGRVHGKIEKLSEDVLHHIDNLRRDIKADIQSAISNHTRK